MEGKPKKDAKPAEPKGVVVASLHGDLKMVIAGDSSVRLLVSFREFPKSRRKKPLSRSESRRELKITPLYATTRDENREAVVESAREGIYTFSAESERGEATRATFTLKIFETAPRGRVANIGTRTITGKTVVARILMPEGILWDDDSAFTGSLEDSESVTKFNAETGVYWKEYND